MVGGWLVENDVYTYTVCCFVIGFIFYDSFRCLKFDIWSVVLYLDRRLMKFEEYFVLAGCSWMVFVTNDIDVW